MKLQDARLWRWPPSQVFGIKPNRRPGKLTVLDVTLADALRMYDDSLCAGCHLPARWVFDIKNAVYFELDPEAPQCVVCELLEDPETSKLDPGEKRHVLNHLVEVDGGAGG